MIKRVLIANRGEIAVRVIRAARELGIETVAVYSDCDRLALHVRMANRAYRLGPSPAAESYLDMDRIFEAARASNADAIHPGYGFLSEKPEFAQRCSSEGIIFVGPNFEAMKQMGDKVSARKTALNVGVPVVPGSEGVVLNSQSALRVAQDIGFPIMVKASAGGGGKGMRLVTAAEQLPSALRDAESEALAAFGDSSVYLEKAILRPRHIEFQILADRHGNVIHLGERECSIQRRHQKVIEECPSPLMTSALRQKMGEAAVSLAKACGYENAGTMEFLVENSGEFYFLEMNTRLQVEHPVTEMVTGIDLVKEQFRIASGERLGLRQGEVDWRGHALECRIYAEDPENQFYPCPGRITRLRVPSGPAVRDDGGIYEGWSVPIYYDPLLSKLVTWGRDRLEAICRMERALSEYQVGGIKTNLSMFRSILAHADFRDGLLSTDFIERLFSSTNVQANKLELQNIALIATILHAGKKQPSSHKKNIESGWKDSARREGLR